MVFLLFPTDAGQQEANSIDDKPLCEVHSFWFNHNIERCKLRLHTSPARRGAATARLASVSAVAVSRLGAYVTVKRTRLPITVRTVDGGTLLDLSRYHLTLYVFRYFRLALEARLAVVAFHS